MSDVTIIANTKREGEELLHLKIKSIVNGTDVDKDKRYKFTSKEERFKFVQIIKNLKVIDTLARKVFAFLSDVTMTITPVKLQAVLASCDITIRDDEREAVFESFHSTVGDIKVLNLTSFLHFFNKRRYICTIGEI